MDRQSDRLLDLERGYEPGGLRAVGLRAENRQPIPAALGTNYGIQAPSLALRTGLSVIEAQDGWPRRSR